MLIVDQEGVEHLGVPIRFAREPASPDLRVPEFGAHSAEVVRSVGYSDADVERLRAEKII